MIEFTSYHRGPGMKNENSEFNIRIVEIGLGYRWFNLLMALVYSTKISPSHSVYLGKILR